MKIKEKQTEKSRETSIKTADNIRLSVAQFGILSWLCVGSLYVRFLIQLLRNFLEKFLAIYIFSATFVDG